MLARLLRPLHRRLPVAGAMLVLALGCAGVMPRTFWHDPSWWWGLGLAAAVAVPALRRPWLACCIVASISLTGMVDVLCGDPRQLFMVMALESLLLLPVLSPVMGLTREQLTSQSCEGALGLTGALAHLVVLFALPSGVGTAGALLLGCLCALLAPGALPFPTSPAAGREPARRQGHALPALTPSRSQLAMPVSVLLCVGFCVWVLQDPALPGQLSWACWLVLISTPLVWCILCGSLLCALLIVLVQLLIMVSLAAAHDPASALLGVLAPASAIPLAWRWWRQQREQPLRGAPVLVVCGVVGIATLSSPAPLTVLLAGISASALIEAPWIRSRRHPLTPASIIASASSGLPSYWRIYLPLKWRLDPVFKQLAQDPRPWGAVLDLGCGPGLGALLASTRSGSQAYCGIDLDLDKLCVARLLLSTAGHPLDGRWQLLEGVLPFSDLLPMRFDTLLVIDVLHYWEPDQQQLLLAYLRRCAQPQAELWLREGASDAVGNTGRVGLGERFTTAVGLNSGGGHLHFFSEPEMAALLRQAGFAIISRSASGAQNRLWRCRAQ